MEARLAYGGRTAAGRRRIFRLAALAAVIGFAAGSPVGAQPPAVLAPHVTVSIADLIAEASQRFGVPATWIAAVIRAESAFDPRATSPKGAMGLMQLMPDTWSALRARLGLGVDPYDPRDNILAGARYLRDLYDQFGAGGFLAAYNAGPGRYLDFVATGRPLPQETRAYVAKVTTVIDGGLVIATSVRTPAASIAPPRPSIFVALTDGRQGVTAPPRTLQPGPAPPGAIAAPSTLNALFVGGWEGVSQ